MKTATAPQIRTIRAIFAQRGIEEVDKCAILLDFTEGRTDSTRALTVAEAGRLIQHLLGTASDERQRRHIIAMAHEMGWKLADGRADLNRINAWVGRYGHRASTLSTLDQYSGADLTKLVTQYQQVYRSYLTHIATI